jgi:hypothetical protein
VTLTVESKVTVDQAVFGLGRRHREIRTFSDFDNSVETTPETPSRAGREENGRPVPEFLPRVPPEFLLGATRETRRRLPLTKKA